MAGSGGKSRQSPDRVVLASDGWLGKVTFQVSEPGKKVKPFSGRISSDRAETIVGSRRRDAMEA